MCSLAVVSAAAFALTYLFGGLTFLPLCVAVAVAFFFYTSPVVHVPRKTGIPSVVDERVDDAEPVAVYRAGWLTVRRTYEPMKEGNGDGTYAGMLASSYRSFMDQRSRDPRRSKPKDRFFAVLKQKTLFLYESEDLAECWAAIDVAAHDVVIYPEGNVDGELWVKRTAIEIRPRRTADQDEAASPVVGEPRSDDAAYDALTGKPLPWFIFAKVNSDKEDWYHSLVLSSRLGYPDSTAAIARDRALFEPSDMARLIEQIDQQPDSIPMRWFNALLGRVFLSAYRTSTLEDYITSRIVRKLKRVKTPAMLSEIQVREVNVGASVPLFSKPMLKELTAEGDASMEVHVAYVGAMRVTIETEATVSLGSRFKPYVVRLVLAVVLRELEGTLLVKIKQPPSNRIWFGFREIPRMALSVEPVVSTRHIKWSLVTGPIESRIRELIAESLVLPHMDDLSFFDTRSEPLSRGGIFGPFLRRERPSQEEELDGPARADREVGPSAPEDEAEELTPGADSATSSTAAIAGETGVPRARRPDARRRRSSEGDHPLDLTPMSGSPDPSSSTPVPTPSAKSASSSSVASLANGLSASLASWREKNAAGASGAGGGSSSSSTISTGMGDGAKRKSSWFAKAGSSASSLGRGESSDSLTSGTTIETGGSAGTTPQEEVSAAKLREILTRRAASRERERGKEKERERAAAVREEDEGDGEGPGAAAFEQKERLALPDSWPVPATDGGQTSPTSVTPNVEAPLVLNEPAPLTPAAVVESPSKAPALPSRPSWVRPVAAPPAPSTPSAPSPSPGLAPSTSSAPPPRRHSPSASVDSASTTSSTLLAAWRTRATDKEALAAGVASAKESMKRWGANWAAKRAQAQGQGQSASGGDLDRPVGESPAKRAEGDAAAAAGGKEGREREREAYRDYRARAGSPAGRKDDALPRTPPRAVVPGFKPASSSLPATQLSPSHALGASPTKASKLAAGPGTGAAYRPVQMMALPGIKDEERRRRVREDHLGGGATAVAAKEATAPASKPEPAASSVPADVAVRQNALEAAAVVPPEPAPAPVEVVPADAPVAPSVADVEPTASENAKTSASDVGDEVESAATEQPSGSLAPSTPPLNASPAMLDASTLPSREHKHKASPLPPLPPRKDGTESVKGSAGAPVVPARPGEHNSNAPPVQPRHEDPPAEDDEADEAGWGLDAQEVVEAEAANSKDTV